MSRRILCRSLCFAVWTLCGLSIAIADDVPPKPVDGEIQWVYGYEAGKQVARETGKPMFVVFRCER